MVAQRMNEGSKIVVWRSMDRARWDNTTILKADLVTEVNALEAGGGGDVTILGSGSIVSQLAQLRWRRTCGPRLILL